MNHPRNASAFIADRERATWHDQALWFVRQKRDKIVNDVPEWESLRNKAQQIKGFVLSNLAELLETFEAQAQARGIHVHWASTPQQHNEIVAKILEDAGAKHVVKSKSMLTEECHLNEYLERREIEVIDTDLGERIVQLRKETPSHIVMPAIHLKKEQVGELFHEELDTEEGLDDPKELADAARDHLREKFMKADAGITGVNFAIAQTGGIVVCTNEGNADLGTSLPKLHIACMGIEKIIPRLADLGVFLRLLARSATGQPITTYSSHFHGPVADGQMHIVLLDNGRSRLAADEQFQSSLSCIRCGACMNTCPVYRRSGGHSYETTVPGPIGSILAPASDAREYATLPHACSLCGSCTDVCPVKIDIHHQLLAWRKRLADNKLIPRRKRWMMKFAAAIMKRPTLYRFCGWFVRMILRWSPRFLVYHRWNTWGKNREMPRAAKQSFRGWIASRQPQAAKGKPSQETPEEPPETPTEPVEAETQQEEDQQ